MNLALDGRLYAGNSAMKLHSAKTSIQFTAAICLALIAGYMDAYGYIVLGTFVSFCGRKFGIYGPKEWPGPFPRSLAIRNTHLVFRSRWFFSKPIHEIQDASFTRHHYWTDCSSGWHGGCSGSIWIVQSCCRNGYAQCCYGHGESCP
jgi:hypothetical protein